MQVLQYIQVMHAWHPANLVLSAYDQILILSYYYQAYAVASTEGLTAIYSNLYTYHLSVAYALS